MQKISFKNLTIVHSNQIYKHYVSLLQKLINVMNLYCNFNIFEGDSKFCEICILILDSRKFVFSSIYYWLHNYQKIL